MAYYPMNNDVYTIFYKKFCNNCNLLFNTKNKNHYLCRKCFQNKPIIQTPLTSVQEPILQTHYQPLCQWCFNKYDHNKSYKHCLSCNEKINMFINNTHPNGYHFEGYYLNVTYTRKQSITEEIPKKISIKFQVPKWMTKIDFVNDVYCGSEYIFNEIINEQIVGEEYEFDQAILCKEKSSISDEMFGDDN